MSKPWPILTTVILLSRFDVETGSHVRTFAGHVDRITDLAISVDGKWLLSSSMDRTLRIWDIPTSRTLQVTKAWLKPYD